MFHEFFATAFGFCYEQLIERSVEKFKIAKLTELAGGFNYPGCQSYNPLLIRLVNTDKRDQLLDENLNFMLLIRY